MTDLTLTRSTVAAYSGVFLVAWFAFCMVLPANDHPAPTRVREAKSFAPRDEKADRMPIAMPVPVEIVPPVATPIPPELIEEEKDEKLPPEVPVLPREVPPLNYQTKQDEAPSKRERHAKAEDDVCTRHGMHKQYYHRGKHESWRCSK